MHSFTFVPPENRAPEPLWVKLGNGKTVMARDAYAGAAPPDAVGRLVLRNFCREFVRKAFPGGVKAWEGMFLNRQPEGTESAPRATAYASGGYVNSKNFLRYVGETRFGVPGGAPLRSPPVRNWPTPNARYMGRCAVCSDTYIGPKRSHLCWEHYEGPEKALPTGR